MDTMQSKLSRSRSRELAQYRYDELDPADLRELVNVCDYELDRLQADIDNRSGRRRELRERLVTTEQVHEILQLAEAISAIDKSDAASREEIRQWLDRRAPIAQELVDRVKHQRARKNEGRAEDKTIVFVPTDNGFTSKEAWSYFKTAYRAISENPTIPGARGNETATAIFAKVAESHLVTGGGIGRSAKNSGWYDPYSKLSLRQQIQQRAQDIPKEALED